jgi:hypothetical protein
VKDTHDHYVRSRDRIDQKKRQAGHNEFARAVKATGASRPREAVEHLSLAPNPQRYVACRPDPVASDIGAHIIEVTAGLR